MSPSVPQHAQPLVGREAEQRALAQALDALADGAGGVVLLCGEPGIGKSALARWATAHARESDLPAYWGFAWEAGGAPPYWIWTQCLRALLAGHNAGADIAAPAAATLAQLIPELGSGESPGIEQLHPHQARFQLLEAVRSLLARAAAGHPFVLVLDDLHAADRESLFLLQHVCQHAAQSGYLVLGTFRELEARLADESSPLWRCAREALLLPLHGLGEQAVGALLEQLRGSPPDLERVRRMLAATEGNPLYLHELLALPGQQGAEPGALTELPGSLHQVIRQHLETLPDDTFVTLAAAAVLGREFESAALAELLVQDENTVVAALQPAVQANLLRPAGESVWRFGHLFHREVLYACLELGERQALHLRRATALERAMQSGLDDAWAELAEHWLAAGPAHRRRAVTAWRSAAQRAGERLAYTESAALFQRALETFGAGPGAEPAERFELMLQTACATLRAGDVDPGHALCLDAYRLARTLEDPVRMARAALAYGSTFTIGAVDPELVRLLRESLAALGRWRGQGASEDWNQLRPRLQARLAAALQPALDPSEPVGMAFEAVEQARATGNRRTLFETLTSAISALMDFAEAEDRLPLNREYGALAEAFDDVPAQFRAHALLFIDGLESGDARLMGTSIGHCARLAARIGLPHYQWRVHAARALLAMVQGELAAAQRHHDLARAEAERADDRLADTTLAIQAFGLLAESGVTDPVRVREAQEAIAAAMAASGADDIFVRPLIARQFLRLGDEQSASSVCSPGDVSRLLGMGEVCNAQVLGDCALLRGDRKLARKVYEALSGARVVCGHSGLYGMTWSGPMALTLARLAAMLGDERAVRAHLEEARRVAGRMGARPLQEQVEAELAGPPAGRPRQAPQAAPGTRTDAAASPSVELVEAGEFWQVRYGGREITIKNSKGVRILARLVADPDREYHALDLNSPAGSAVVEPALDEAGVGGLDAQARTAYRERLAEIEERLQEAREMNDAGAAETLLEEREALQRELARAFGLGGRGRRTGTAAERARVNVTRRIRDAIGRIGEHSPEAVRYLDSTIKTGTYCKYSPL